MSSVASRNNEELRAKKEELKLRMKNESYN